MNDESNRSQTRDPRPGATPVASGLAGDRARDPILAAAVDPPLPAASGRPSAVTASRLALLSDTVLPALFLGGLVYASWVIVLPFLGALTWAVMIAYATYPLYERLRALFGGRGGLAAATMSLLSAVVLFAPLVWGAFAAQ